MPMNRSLYPDDWEAISERIRFGRAGGRCEECGAPHGMWILRSRKNPDFWILDVDGSFYRRSDGQEFVEIPSEFEPYEDAWIRVILTTHHKGVDKPDGTPGDPDDKMDCRDENLAALCQRCHLAADKPNHISKAHLTRNRKRHEALASAGNVGLFDNESLGGV